MLSDGDFFGEIALLKIVARTATINMDLPTVLLTLSPSDFLQTLADSPALREELERVMTQRNCPVDRPGFPLTHFPTTWSIDWNIFYG